MLSVPEDDVAYIAYSQSVYEDLSGMHSFYHLCRLAAYFQYISGLEHEDILFWNSKCFCDSGVGFSVAVFPVDGNGVLWLY